jgi:hypothetical protein
MKNLREVEVFYIEEPNKDGEMFAWISYNDPNWKGDDPTNGYDHIRIPVKLRPIQKSVNDGTLIDQSEKNYSTASGI